MTGKEKSEMTDIVDAVELFHSLDATEIKKRIAFLKRHVRSLNILLDLVEKRDLEKPTSARKGRTPQKTQKGKQ
jgi:hypothetical protein